jgi:hypothetical protein
VRALVSGAWAFFSLIACALKRFEPLVEKWGTESKALGAPAPHSGQMASSA